jgi:ppGpp synthetase/RelA/SpoT-type nucleotidyltranferase
MDLIDQFLARYTREYDFYSQVARIAHQKLEASLQTAGVRAMVTARAKSIARLQDKCRQREAENESYASVDEIYEDIVDLAGVRVALYFAGEVDQVDGTVSRLFNVLLKKDFPDRKRMRPNKRFTGYSARHYRVQLKEDDLDETEKRYASARVEIQVASVLMHAWAEVEHDLVYKPMTGDLSEDEHAILDELNGLVLAGEIALERLQRAGEARVAESDRKIVNHYDLAVHLLSAAEDITDQPISESGLGRVDHLFDLIRTLRLDTPGQLKPYIEALHGNIEVRPPAEQVIDALLAEDPSRYEIYESIRAQRPWGRALISPDDEAYAYIGKFMARWIELEALLRELAGPQQGRGPIIPSTLQLASMDLLSKHMLREFDRLRRLRNMLVHGIEMPTLADLDEATRSLEAVLAAIRRRLREERDNE